MTELGYEQLAPARRRRLLLRTCLQALAITTVLVWLYYTLPLDERSTAWTVTQLLLGLVVVAGLLVWQVRAIVGSEFPRMRMIRALFVAIPFYVLIFAVAYFLLAGPATAPSASRCPAPTPSTSPSPCSRRSGSVTSSRRASWRDWSSPSRCSRT